MSVRFHILTGAPGSGKTSVIGALAHIGIVTVPESGRAIIREQVACGGTALPWLDRAAFADLMLRRELHSYEQASACGGMVIFDRGIPDVVGYLRLCDLPVPQAAMRAAATCRYGDIVFLAPHWPAIFAQDEERRQSAVEAAATAQMMAEVYTELGYTIVTLPLGSVAERADFIRAQVT